MEKLGRSLKLQDSQTCPKNNRKQSKLSIQGKTGCFPHSWVSWLIAHIFKFIKIFQGMIMKAGMYIVNEEERGAFQSWVDAFQTEEVTSKTFEEQKGKWYHWTK